MSEEDDVDDVEDQPKSPDRVSQPDNSELEISPASAGPNLGRASAISVQASAFAAEKVKDFEGDNKASTLVAARPSAISVAEAHEPEIELLTILDNHVGKWRNGSTDLFD